MLAQHLLNQQVMGTTCEAMFAAFPSAIPLLMEVAKSRLHSCGSAGGKNSNATHPHHLPNSAGVVQAWFPYTG